MSAAIHWNPLGLLLGSWLLLVAVAVLILKGGTK